VTPLPYRGKSPPALRTTRPPRPRTPAAPRPPARSPRHPRAGPARRPARASARARSRPAPAPAVQPGRCRHDRRRSRSPRRSQRHDDPAAAQARPTSADTEETRHLPAPRGSSPTSGQSASAAPQGFRRLGSRPTMVAPPLPARDAPASGGAPGAGGHPMGSTRHFDADDWGAPGERSEGRAVPGQDGAAAGPLASGPGAGSRAAPAGGHGVTGPGHAWLVGGSGERATGPSPRSAARPRGPRRPGRSTAPGGSGVPASTSGPGGRSWRRAGAWCSRRRPPGGGPRSSIPLGPGVKRAWSALGRSIGAPGLEHPGHGGTTYLVIGRDGRNPASRAQPQAACTPARRRVSATDTSGSCCLQRPPGRAAAPRFVPAPATSYVPIPARLSNKINAAYAFGRGRLLVRTVEAVRALHVDGYVETGPARVRRSRGTPSRRAPCASSGPMKDHKAGLNVRKGCQTSTARRPSAMREPGTPIPWASLGARASAQRQVMAAIASKASSLGVLAVRGWPSPQRRRAGTP